MREQQKYTIMSAKQATGIGNIILVEDYRHKELTIATTGMGAGDTIVVKVQGSSQEDPPTFTSAKSATNLWDYIECKEQEDGTDLNGDEGITITEQDDVRKIAVNVDGLRWLTVNVTTISDAVNTSVTVTVNLYND